MSTRKRKNKTEKEILYEKRWGRLQDFQLPPNENSKRYIKLTHYMLAHENFKKLSSSAKVVLIYMFDWAFGSEEYLESGVFAFSTTLLTRNKVMANKTAISAMKELEYYGFIDKMNNACQSSGMTQKWRFSSRWYTGVKRTI